jgi:putative membrane protein
MKDIIRKSLVNALSIFLVSLFMSGLVVKGGFASFIYAGILLAIFSTVLDPVVKIVTMPFNILTLGLLSFLTTLVALIALTIFYNNVSITAFTINSVAFLGGSAGNIQVSQILSYVLISATIYFLGKVVDFIFKN